MNQDADSDSAVMKALPANEAAKIIIDAIEKDKYRVFVGKDSKMMDLMYRISPKRAAAFISKQMQALLAD